jgi:hypothetical protein
LRPEKELVAADELSLQIAAKENPILAIATLGQYSGQR